MAQRSITSFFTAPKAKPKVESKPEEALSPTRKDDAKPKLKTPENPVLSSPLKSGGSPTPEKAVPGKKGKRRIVSTSSEDDENENLTEGASPIKSDSDEDKPKRNGKATSTKEVAPKPKKRKSKSSDSEEESPTEGCKTPDETANKGPCEEEAYDPSSPKYHPINSACWKRDERVPYLAIAKTLQCIEGIKGRLRMTQMLSNLFRSVIVLTPDDLLCCVYLCLNQISPAWEGIELGVGEMVVMRALAQSTGRTLDKLKAEVAEKGDLGIIAESSRTTQRTMFAPPKLTARTVFDKLKQIAMMSGNAVQSKKVERIQSMLVACRLCEARYIIRSLSGKLRVGLAEQTLLAALALASCLTPPNQDYPHKILDSSKSVSAEKFKARLDSVMLSVKTAYCECPSYDKLIGVLLEFGVEGLREKCKITPGVPMKPMLAHPTKGVDEVLKRFEKATFTCEYKYDGERAQIHVLANGRIEIYSRNQENNTSKFPDVISRWRKAVQDGARVESCILDSEIVAWDQAKGGILPFQILSTRKRKDAVESDIKVTVKVFAFDLLYLNGESMTDLPFGERRKVLKDTFREVDNEFGFVTSMDSSDVEEIQEFLEESVKDKCEGLMVKTLDIDASYEIAKRSHNWLKLKKDYLEGVGDTLDLVVIGGYRGKGKRTGHFGGFLLACYDEDNEEFQTICKLGTGFKDEDLEAHSQFFKDHEIPKPKPYYRHDPTVNPDVWFDAVQVWEIKCADLSISPVHRAAVGIVDSEKGLSLRFPRFLRVRTDKKVEQATDASQVASMYKNQEQVKNQQKGGGAKTAQEIEEDFY